MRTSLIYVVFSFWCIIILLNACKKDEPKVSTNVANKYQIELRWNKSYSLDTRENAETGFLWAMSFLGAEWPLGSYNKAVAWSNNNMVVDFEQLGFHQQGLDALAKLIAIFKQSDEYKRNGAIDLGRFIALTLNASNHYYAITGIARNFDSFKVGKIFDAKQFAATNSSISFNDRIIDLPDSNNTNFRQSAYVSNECEGKIKEGKIGVTAYEVKEQMSNGQFRFAIYDTTGQLITVAKGTAGKPAKCIWCHESYIQTLFTEQIDEPNYYGADMFKYIVKRNNYLLAAYRKTLQTDLDFEKLQDHTYLELLYISFLEPSAERLAGEWGLPLEQVKVALKDLPTHTYSEFPFLGALYYREEVEPFSPYYAIKPPSSARNKSAYEPNLIN